MADETRSTAAGRALRKLRTPRTTALESTSESTAGERPPDLRDTRIQSSLEIARDRFRQISERTNRGGDVTPEQLQVLKDAEAVLRKLATEGETADVTGREFIALEAIVIVDGTRPALFVQDDDVDPAVPETGTWQNSISELRVGIGSVAASVGRLNAEIGFPNYGGTGFVVGDGLILTNRHVLEGLAVGENVRADGTWEFKKPVTIDFAAEYERERTRSFKVTGVAFAGPEQIGFDIVLSKLDVALLHVERDNGTENLPPPLPLSRRIKAVRQQSEVYVMGYPARPNNEVGRVLMDVFQDEYFVKRFAPGYVDQDPDTVDDGGHKRVLTHDASTLSGNSGSCIIEFRIEGKAVVGLHFGGSRRVENYGHSIARIEQVLTEFGVVFQDN